MQGALYWSYGTSTQGNTHSPHPLTPPTTPQVLYGEIDSERESMAELTRRLLKKDNLPEFEPVQLTYDMLEREGARLEAEQQLVNNHKLSEEYLKNLKLEGAGGLIGLMG